jgi:hypothetical protein
MCVGNDKTILIRFSSVLAAHQEKKKNQEKNQIKKRAPKNPPPTSG